MLKELLVIRNPRSGQGTTPLDGFLHLLHEEDYGITVRYLHRNLRVQDLLYDAANYHSVIAAGGDGTVSSVAHAMIGLDTPILAYPAGTANLISQNLGLVPNVRELAQVVMQEETLTCDLAEIHLQDMTFGFTMVAGAGLDADMIRESETLKPNFGVLAYFMGVFKNLRATEADILLELDGVAVRTRGMSVLLANFGMVNFGIPLAPGIDPADGLLSVIVVKGNTPLAIVPKIMDSFVSRMGLKTIPAPEGVEIYTCKSVRIQSDPPLPIQYDGELLDATTPLTARVIPHAVRFLVPARTQRTNT